MITRVHICMVLRNLDKIVCLVRVCIKNVCEFNNDKGVLTLTYKMSDRFIPQARVRDVLIMVNQ